MRSYRVRMTEPPRPPGEGNPSDPTAPLNPYPGNDPNSGSAPPPAYGSPQPPAYGTPPQQPPTYGTPPPTSGAGGYGPPPSSGAGGYGPPPGSGAGGYGPPPGGTPYGPPGAYGQQPGGYPPGGYAPGNDDKTWILVAHFGGAAGAFLGGGCSGWIAPLVALLAKGNQSPAVRAEAVKALNFQILWSIIAVVGWVLTCIVIGFFVGIAAWAIATIFGIVAGVKANNNEPYNYPMTVSLIK
ncbi:hypothetical protein Aau02nite_39390 [Amorphoplanes auranticolor]|uniref:Tic20 family protein n=2 Tax=Actinoplanes auranticolor TaxID=47988 RepID=A0A919VNN5_9ACTN|nr:hypothetical protein Aau02nite_39390 [Actinoplanes auranticolor]